MNILKNVFSKKYINKMNKKISFLGPNNKIKVEHFLITRLLVSICLFIVFLLIPKYGLLIALFTSISFYYLYTLVLLDSKIKDRSDKLYDEAILFFSMLKVSLNNTKDLKASLDLVSNKSGNSLALTFRNCLGNNKYNNDLNSVFINVMDTIPNIDVKKSLMDLKENDFNSKTIDNIVNELKEKRLIIVKQSYQLKPLIMLFVGLIFLSIIFVLLFNMNQIIDYFVS